MYLKNCMKNKVFCGHKSFGQSIELWLRLKKKIYGHYDEMLTSSVVGKFNAIFTKFTI